MGNPDEEEPVPARLALIDTRPLTLESVARLLTTRCRDFHVRTYPNSGALLADDVSRKPEIDILMVNIGSARMSDDHVHDELRQLSGILSDTPLVLLSDHADRADVVQALRCGVRAYIPTTFTFDVVVGVLRLVQAGGSFVPPSVVLESLPCMPLLDADRPFGGRIGIAPDCGIATEGVAKDVADESADTGFAEHGFTARQIEVLQLLQQGKPDKVIAWELNMQESTAKVHVRAILKKLRATNRTQAAYRAQQIFSASKAL